MTSEEYGQYIDDFELSQIIMPGESLTEKSLEEYVDFF